MNGLIKQLFTSYSPVDQLAEHSTEDLKRSCWSGFESKEFCKKKNCFNFHKMNRCYYLRVLVVVIQLFPIMSLKLYRRSLLYRVLSSLFSLISSSLLSIVSSILLLPLLSLSFLVFFLMMS